MKRRLLNLVSGGLHSSKSDRNQHLLVAFFKAGNFIGTAHLYP